MNLIPIVRWIACYRFVFSIALFAVFLAGHSNCAHALVQSETESPADGLRQRIRKQVADLNSREMANAPNRELGYRWTVLGYEYSNAGEFTNSENAYNHALDLLRRDPADADFQAEALDQLGALYRIFGRIPESLNCRRKALELRMKLGDARLIALSESHLAEVALVSRKYREALRRADEAYRGMIAAGSDVRDRVGALIVRSYAKCGVGLREECLADAAEAVALSRGAFPAQSTEVASSLMALSVAQLRNRLAAQAEDSVREALGVLRTQLTAGDPRLVFVLSQSRDCLVALHRREEAREVEAQLAAIDGKAAGSCAQCTVSAFGLRGGNR